MRNPPVYVADPLFSTTSLTPYYGVSESKGLKSYLGLAVGAIASIAVPFLAPAVAGAFGGGFFASTIGQSLIGAGIGALGGAAGQAIGGGDPLQGALFGGLGGAVAGGASAYFGGAGATTAAAGGTAAPAGLTTTGIEAGQLAGTAGLSTAGVAGAAAPAAGGFSSALTTGVGGKLTDAFLQMAPNAISTAFTSMQGGQQEALLKQLEQEMQVARTSNLEDYNNRKQLYDRLFGIAEGISPEYYGKLAQADVQRQTAQQVRENVRDKRLQGGASQAEYQQNEGRRLSIMGAAEAADAYQSGYGRGLDAQGSAYARAASVPTGYNNTSSTYGLTNLYNISKKDDEEKAAGLSRMISPFSYALMNDPAPQKVV